MRNEIKSNEAKKATRGQNGRKKKKQGKMKRKREDEDEEEEEEEKKETATEPEVLLCSFPLHSRPLSPLLLLLPLLFFLL